MQKAFWKHVEYRYRDQYFVQHHPCVPSSTLSNYLFSRFYRAHDSIAHAKKRQPNQPRPSQYIPSSTQRAPVFYIFTSCKTLDPCFCFSLTKFVKKSNPWIFLLSLKKFQKIKSNFLWLFLIVFLKSWKNKNLIFFFKV